MEDIQTSVIKQLPTQKSIEDSIVAAFDVLKGVSKSSTITASSLTKYSDGIQRVLNEFLKRRGAITQQQLDELDEKVREAKKKTLEAQAKNTYVKYGIYISLLVAGFGTLWILNNKYKN